MSPKHRFHRRRGNWFFILFVILVFSGLFGKSNSFPFILPFILFWLFGPLLWGLSGGEQKPKGRRRVSRPFPGKHPASQPFKKNVAQRQKPILTEHQPRSQTLRSLAGLPTACSACGGPVDRQTLLWRGADAHCGFCETKLKS